MGSLGFVVLSLLLSARLTLAVLPTTFTVTSYDLTLGMTVPTTTGNPTVTGTVIMTLKCATASNVITFHWGKSLTPTNPSSTDITVQKTTGTAAAVTFNVILNTDETLIINTTPPTAGGTTFVLDDTVTVTAKFGTTINQDLKGLFLRQVPNGDNTFSSYVTTSMLPTYARNVFPCLDEPTFPATMTLTLTHPLANWKSGASLPLTVTTSDTTTGITTDKYSSAVTLTPSALSVFFSNMSNTTYAQSRADSKLYFWYPKNYPNTTLQSTMNFLANYFYQVEDLLTIPYPLANGLNIILVPGLAEPYAGYGFIFIRNDSYARDYSTPQTEGLFKMSVVPVLDQFLRQFTEFSTRPALWSDSWMSDAFAGYLQYVLLQTIGTPFDIRTDLEVVSRQMALQQDSSQITALPLQDTVSETTSSSTSVLEALFMSPLRKLKGPFLLAMLDMSLPAGAVFAAIKTVLKNYKQTTLTSAQFYTQINTNVTLSGAYVSADTRRAIDSLPFWFNSSGYPLLNVTSVTLGSPGNISLLLGTFPVTSNLVLPKYYVAATVGSRSDPRYYNLRQDIWVNSTTKVASLNVNDGDWVATNLQSSGYYRSQYSTPNWGLVGDAITRGEILGHTQLIDDAFALFFAGLLDSNTTMRLATANMRETKFRNWFPVDKGLQQIRNHFLGLSLYTTYRNFMIGFLRDVNSLLTSSLIEDQFEKARISSLFMDEMCEFNVERYRVYALGNLTALLQGNLPSNVPSSSYEKMVCCAAQYSTSLVAQNLWTNITNPTATYYRKHFNAIALGCLANYSQIDALNSTILDTQNIALKPYVMTIYQYVAEVHPADFLAGIPKLSDKLQAQLGEPAFANLMWSVGQKINNNTQISVLSGLVTGNTNDFIKQAANATIVSVNRRVEWLASNNVSLVQAIAAHTQATSHAASTPVPFMLFFIPCLVLFVTVFKMECI